MSDTGQPTSYIEVLAPIWPGGDFGSHEDVFGKGGFVTLQDSIGSDNDTDFINDRVRKTRRKEGMLVYINDNERYYRCTDIGTGNTNGVWKREYFSGRYFHGPTAPTADDIVMGERWFDTVVGTEYTYVPIAEGSTYLSWVDLDHIGEGDRYINSDGDIFTGTLTGDILDVNHITADTGFIGTLTGNYIDIPSLGDFGSQIRVASNGSLGMPYIVGSMHSLDLWSRLHLIGGGGATGYSLRITTSAVGSTIEDSQGKMIFDQGYTHGVAIAPYGTSDIIDSEFDDPIAGISIFGTNLYTGQNNRSDPSMPYQGLTNDQYSGMLSLEMDGRGYIPRMFSTRRTDLLDTFDNNEFITKRHFENNTRSETGSVYIQFSITVNSPSNGGNLNSWIRDIPVMGGDGNEDISNSTGSSYHSIYIGSRDVPFPKPWKVTVLRHYYPAAALAPGVKTILSTPHLQQGHAAKNACMKNSFVVGEGKYLGVEQRVFENYINDNVATFFGTGNDAGLDSEIPAGLGSVSSSNWKRIKCAAHRYGSYPVPINGTYYTEIYIVPVDDNN